MNAASASEVPDDDEIGPGTPTSSPWPRITPARAVCLVAVLVALGWSFEPNLIWFYQTWVREPDYTHGFLVGPIALVILWYRWPRAEAGAEAVPIIPWWPGWLLVAAPLLVRPMFLERGMHWMEAATLLPVLVGLALTSLGWRIMLRIWPAFAFLIFLYPLPPQINSTLSQPLQSLATTFACPAPADGALGHARGERDPGRQREAGSRRRLQRALDADEPGGHGRGGGQPGADVELETILAAAQHRPDRAGEQHPPDRGDGLVLLPVRGPGGQPVCPRLGRLADDADRDGPGGAGTGHRVVADRRVRGGREDDRPAGPEPDRRPSDPRQPASGPTIAPSNPGERP